MTQAPIVPMAAANQPMRGGGAVSASVEMECGASRASIIPRRGAPRSALLAKRTSAKRLSPSATRRCETVKDVRLPEAPDHVEGHRLAVRGGNDVLEPLRPG